MTSASVLQAPPTTAPAAPQGPAIWQPPPSDPLSEVLSLLKPRSYSSGGFAIEGEAAIFFPRHGGIKCYALLTGDCYLILEAENNNEAENQEVANQKAEKQRKAGNNRAPENSKTPEPSRKTANPPNTNTPQPEGPTLPTFQWHNHQPAIHLTAGDCFLLPRGIPFQLTTRPGLEPLLYTQACVQQTMTRDFPAPESAARFMAGGHFAFDGPHVRMLLDALPPVVHIRGESGKAALRWSLERMREELRNPQPGGALIAQQLACSLLVQALRLHLASTPATGLADSSPQASSSQGWLSALADPHMSQAISHMHAQPGHPWTLQTLAERTGMSRSVFAQRFRDKVGSTPMEYLTRWRMMLAASRLSNSTEGVSQIAHSLGYESESAFTKAFRRIMGCSPRQYTRTSPAKP